MANAGRNISLTDRQSQFVDQQVAAGRHVSASEVVREALRRYEDDVAAEQAQLDALRRLAAEGDSDMAQGNYVRVQDRAHLHRIIQECGEEAVRMAELGEVAEDDED